MKPLKVGMLVRYAQPKEDEAGVVFTLYRMDAGSDWALLRAEVGLALCPTQTANLSELVAVDLPEHGNSMIEDIAKAFPCLVPYKSRLHGSLPFSCTGAVNGVLIGVYGRIINGTFDWEVSANKVWLPLANHSTVCAEDIKRAIANQVN